MPAGILHAHEVQDDVQNCAGRKNHAFVQKDTLALKNPPHRLQASGYKLLSGCFKNILRSWREREKGAQIGIVGEAGGDANFYQCN